MANLITISRFPLLIFIILLLYSGDPVVRVISVFLLIILIALDSLDGIVARRRNEVSLLGSVLDIMTDRSVELVMWVVYAHLGLVPVAIPIIFILRGVTVDSLRSVHVVEGETPFKSMRTRIGSWIVGSPWMRSTYGIVKMLSFAGLALAHALNAYVLRGTVAAGTATLVSTVFNVLSWVAVALCLIRGLPVIIEAFAFLGTEKKAT